MQDVTEGVYVLRNPLGGALDMHGEDRLGRAPARVAFKFKLDTQWALRPVRVGVGEPPRRWAGGRADGVLPLQVMRLHERIEDLPECDIEPLVHLPEPGHVPRDKDRAAAACRYDGPACTGALPGP